MRCTRGTCEQTRKMSVTAVHNTFWLKGPTIRWCDFWENWEEWTDENEEPKHAHDCRKEHEDGWILTETSKNHSFRVSDHRVSGNPDKPGDFFDNVLMHQVPY